MIRVYRTTEVPSFSHYPIFRKMKAELKKFYEMPETKRRQHRPPYIPLPESVLQKVRTYLLKEFNGKCAYCESAITSVNHGDFDHFRPKSSARGLNEEFSLNHYWTLAFDWRNMYMCCETCNQYKLNWFPIGGKRALLSQTFLQILKSEENLLIDPCNEDPATHVGYKKNGYMVAFTKKGEITIDILKLNRKKLVEDRKKTYEELFSKVVMLSTKAKTHSNLTVLERSALSSLIEQLADISKAGSTKEFIGIQLFFFEKWFKEDKELVSLLLEYDEKKLFRRFLSRYKDGLLARQMKSSIKEKEKVAIKKTAKPGSTLLKRFNIESIVIENFKLIEKLEIKFPVAQQKKEPWLMLLGENGVGKSSFLQAVTLALMGESYRKNINIKPHDILRYNTTKGFVRINQVGAAPIELHFTSSIMHNNLKTAPTYLLSYGSTRLFPGKNLKPERTTGRIRARNMFSPEVALFADSWLIKLYRTNKKNFDYAARALKAILAKELEDPGISLTVKDKDVMIHYSDPDRSPDKLRSLSDGYKSIIAVACDMMNALKQGNSTMEVAEGIVLIDEIGTHLHPRWKMRVVNSFREAFPKLQFIVTTHDPLCLKGLKAGEIAVFDKNKEGQVYSVMDLPDPGEFSAEQLLSSKFFGLSSTVDDELEKEFNQYYELLGKQKRTAGEQKKLQRLKEKLRDKKHLGSSLREELALNAADTLLAKDKAEGQSTKLTDLKQQTVDMLAEIWDKPLDEKEKTVQS